MERQRRTSSVRIESDTPHDKYGGKEPNVDHLQNSV
jgi:hypothetical protein